MVFLNEISALVIEKLGEKPSLKEFFNPS